MESGIASCYLRPAGRGFFLILALYRLGAIHVYSLAPSRYIESLPSRLGTTTPTKPRASQRLPRPVCRRAVRALRRHAARFARFAVPERTARDGGGLSNAPWRNIQRCDLCIVGDRRRHRGSLAGYAKGDVARGATARARLRRAFDGSRDAALSGSGTANGRPRTVQTKHQQRRRQAVPSQ